MDETPIAYIRPVEDGWILVNEDGEAINAEVYPDYQLAADQAPYEGYVLSITNDCGDYD